MKHSVRYLPLANNSGGTFGGTSYDDLTVKKSQRFFDFRMLKNVSGDSGGISFLQFPTFKARKVQEIGVIFQLTGQTRHFYRQWCWRA